MRLVQATRMNATMVQSPICHQYFYYTHFIYALNSGSIEWNFHGWKCWPLLYFTACHRIRLVVTSKLIDGGEKEKVLWSPYNKKKKQTNKKENSHSKIFNPFILIHMMKCAWYINARHCTHPLQISFYFTNGQTQKSKQRTRALMLSWIPDEVFGEGIHNSLVLSLIYVSATALLLHRISYELWAVLREQAY